MSELVWPDVPKQSDAEQWGDAEYEDAPEYNFWDDRTHPYHEKEQK